MKTGVLLMNTGTPDAPSTSAVRRYLRSFLSDPRVIDIPSLARFALLEGVILPFRSAKSAKAYQSVWTTDSPLRLLSQQLDAALQSALGESYQVALGMRYGKPSIRMGLERLLASNADKILLMPLFPQYASASTGSCLEEALRLLSRMHNVPEIRVLNHFYAEPFFIKAQASIIQDALVSDPWDHLLLSYHGLPQRQVRISDGGRLCDQNTPCPAPTGALRYCYRAQCYATTQALIKALAIDAAQTSTAFQSRLGASPWIKPYTDLRLPELYQQGVRHLVVACPSFVTDCLETIEEIGLRGREDWLALGGSSYKLVPCLNAEKPWVEALKSHVQAVSSDE